MSAAKELLTASRLREVIAYDGPTGVLSWAVCRGSTAKVGDVAGTLNARGYLVIRVDGCLYLAHRLAWLHVHGAWPERNLDHVNGIRIDNRLSNLRDVSQAANIQNERKARITNLLGVLGVSQRGAVFMARIRVDGRMVRLGSYGSAEAAHQAYLDAKRMHHEGCTL